MDSFFFSRGCFAFSVWCNTAVMVYLFLSFFRYWNDQDVLKKIGEAMGFAAAGEGATSSEIPGADETEEANEDESVVHQCASVGDAEVLFKFNFLLQLGPKVGMWLFHFAIFF